MKLIIGIGNTGEKFKGTRHNIGREIVMMLCREAEFPEFRFEKKWNARVSEGKLGKEKTTLLLPETFVNKSGAAVAPAARFYKAKPREVFLIHDDVDLPIGRAKLSFGAHSAGHKGVESVFRALKTREVWRFRIGIGNAGRKKISAARVVLKKFSPDEARTIKKVIKKTIEAIRVAITQRPDLAMNEYNRG